MVEFKLEITASLRSQGYPVREVFRMLHRHTKKPYDMITVLLDRTKEGKSIFSLKSVCGLSGVSVEPPRKSHIPSQGHNCQNYGHSASGCFLKPWCVKCLEDHPTRECKRTPETATPPSYQLSRVWVRASYQATPPTQTCAEGTSSSLSACASAPNVHRGLPKSQDSVRCVCTWTSQVTNILITVNIY